MEVTSVRQLGDMTVMRRASRFVMVIATRAIRRGQTGQSLNSAITANAVINHEVLAARV
jgi:hypothetical protein